MFSWARAKVYDSLVNFVTGLGTWKDPTKSAQHMLTLLNRNEIENAYRGDWVARKIVDAPAEDATRAWRNWVGSQNQIESIQDCEKTFHVQNKMKLALIRARLYGGAAIVIGIDDGRESWEPINFDAVKKGSLKFLVVMNRYELMAGPRIYNVMSEWYTRPEYYTVSTPMFGFEGELGSSYPGVGSSGAAGEVGSAKGQATPPAEGSQRYANPDVMRQQTPVSGMVRIHPSRVVEFVGNDLPDWRLAPMGGGWGDSILQTVDDAIKDFGVSVGGIAAMINDAKMDVIKLPDFNERITASEYTNRLLTRFSIANQSKSAINSILLDKEEDWTRITTNFGGLPNLLHEFMMLIAAAGGLPPSRVFGQSIGKGMGSGKGGDSDLRNYYDDISSEQNNDYGVRMAPLDQCIIRSSLGKYDPKVHYEWAPLWELEPKEKADINLANAQATQVDVMTGLINEDILRKGRVNRLIEDNVYPGLEDAIEEHGAEPNVTVSRLWSPGIDPNTGEPITPPSSGGDEPDAGGGEPLVSGGQPPKPKKIATADATPRSLYVRRDVLNGAAILKWARKQGIPNLLKSDDLHVTIAYSREAVDWIKMGDDQWATDKDDNGFAVKAGGPRVVEKFGNSLVLAFACSRLAYRHQNMVYAGATWDYDDYNPHVSLTRDPDPSGGFDWTKVEPYRGEIVLGPEIFEEIVE